MKQIRVATFAGPGADGGTYGEMGQFTEDGLGRGVADAMAMKAVKSTVVPWPELLQETEAAP